MSSGSSAHLNGLGGALGSSARLHGLGGAFKSQYFGTHKAPEIGMCICQNSTGGLRAFRMVKRRPRQNCQKCATSTREGSCLALSSSMELIHQSNEGFNTRRRRSHCRPVPCLSNLAEWWFFTTSLSALANLHGVPVTQSQKRQGSEKVE